MCKCCVVTANGEPAVYKHARNMTTATTVLSIVALILSILCIFFARTYTPVLKLAGAVEIGLAQAPFGINWFCGATGGICVPFPNIVNELLKVINDNPSGTTLMGYNLLSSSVTRSEFEAMQSTTGGTAAVTVLVSLIVAITSCGTLAYYGCLGCCCGCCKAAPGKVSAAAPGPIVMFVFSLIGLITSGVDVSKVSSLVGDAKDLAAALGKDAPVQYGSGYGMMVFVMIIYICFLIMHGTMVILHIANRGKGSSVKAVSSVRMNPVSVPMGASSV